METNVDTQRIVLTELKTSVNLCMSFTSLKVARDSSYL